MSCGQKYVDEYKSGHLMAKVKSVLIATKKVFITLDLDVDYPKPTFGQMIIAMEKSAYEKLNGLELESKCDIKIMTKGEAAKKAIASLSEKRRKKCTKYLEQLGVIWEMPYEKIPYDAHTVSLFADRKRTWHDARMSWWSMAEDLKT